jgi:hypothetical protein
MKRMLLLLVTSTLLISACGNRFSKTEPKLTTLTNGKTIEFSGYNWIVSDSKTPVAPGPNFWSNDNVWVDAEGNLHLKITKDKNGLWSCAELRTTEKLGLGEYEFWVEGELDQLDQNIVFGMFNYSGRDHKDEIDIEISRWGNDQQNNLHYTVYPKRGRNNWKASSLLKLQGSYSTHRFIRSRSNVLFQSLHGFQTEDKQEIFSAGTDTDNISTDPMPVFVNLWLFGGKAPTNGSEAEIIIHRFRFTPH